MNVHDQVIAALIQAIRRYMQWPHEQTARDVTAAIAKVENSQKEPS